MRFEASQQMRLGQQMKLAPRMIQSMEILQMPLAELEERIEQELASNIALEQAEGEADAQALAQERKEADRAEHEGERALQVDEGSARDDFERLESYEEANPDAAANEFEAPEERTRADDFEPREFSRARLDGEPDAKHEAMSQAPARGASLHEQLLDQWRLSDVDEALRPLGALIISFLDDDGYLRTPLAEVADKAPRSVLGDRRPSDEELERALKAVQLFLDPPGIAARDARECLILQLDALEDDETWDDDEDKRRTLDIARTLVEHHLDDLTQNRLPRIAEKTGLSMDQIKTGLTLMRRLSLAPARRLVIEEPQVIIPDAIVEYDEEHDRYIAYLNDSRLPNLQINKMYSEMVRDRAVPKTDREFIRTNLSNAQWLIDAVQQRKHTLLRVINVVVDAQRDFFDYGPQALKPLPMTQVAEQLGIHVATVSRAVADKYLLTPRGVVPLRRFFTGGTQTDTGEEVSWEAIKSALKEVIDTEDKSKPLSDDALADELKKRGFEIARRTVAKYRDQMQIPSARLRKAF